jgi:hypothetical protein
VASSRVMKRSTSGAPDNSYIAFNPHQLPDCT